MAATEPTGTAEPDPLEDQVESAVLEDEEGDEYVVDQQNVGPESAAEGGGEWPDPDAEPDAPAPGAVD